VTATRAPWWRGYKREYAGRDAIAGVVAACVVVPQCVAYASLAGLPPQTGLYVATLPLAVYAFLGGSRFLSVTVTSTISVLTAQILLDVGGDPTENAAALALIVGAMLLALWILRLGNIVGIISLPILTGFKMGVGLVVISSQVGKVLGIPVDGDNFVENMADVFRGLDDIHWRTAGVAAGSFAILIGLRFVAPKVPAALVAVAFGITVVAIFDLADKGVAVLGSFSGGLPDVGVPDPVGWAVLLPGAAGIALMSAVESLTAARVLATAGDPEIDPNREVRAVGAANVAAGLTGAYPAGGGLSQSVVNANAGAVTQASSLVTAVIALVIVTVATGVLEDLPQATLGALVILAVWGFLDPKPLLRIRRIRTRDFGLAIVALVCAATLGMLQGVLFAFVASFLVLLYQLNHAPVEDVTPVGYDGLLMLRPRGVIYFANADHMRDETRRLIFGADPKPRVVLVDFVSVPDVEVTMFDSAQRLTEDVRAAGIQPWIAGLSAIEMHMLREWGYKEDLRIFPTADDALRAYAAEQER
jgi:high affinity sulfate transporter 1